jgi:hypothetical protein
MRVDGDPKGNKLKVAVKFSRCDALSSRSPEGRRPRGGQLAIRGTGTEQVGLADCGECARKREDHKYHVAAADVVNAENRPLYDLYPQIVRGGASCRAGAQPAMPEPYASFLNGLEERPRRAHPLPANKEWWPHPDYVSRHRENYAGSAFQSTKSDDSLAAVGFPIEDSEVPVHQRKSKDHKPVLATCDRRQSCARLLGVDLPIV